MFGLFKRKKRVDTEENRQGEANRVGQAAPGTEIRYDPNLIKQLEGEHKALLALYGEMSADFKTEQFEKVSAKLVQFRTALQAHLLTENVRLYIYLEHLLANDESNHELMHGFRREMNDIGKTAMAFLKKYETIGVDRDLAPSFERDFATIGEVLGQRIQSEENTLYPLYIPNL